MFFKSESRRIKEPSETLKSDFHSSPGASMVNTGKEINEWTTLFCVFCQCETMLEQFEDVVEDWYFHHQDQRLETFLCQGHALKTSEQGGSCYLVFTASSQCSHTLKPGPSCVTNRGSLHMIRNVLQRTVDWLVKENKRNCGSSPTTQGRRLSPPKWVLNWFQNFNTVILPWTPGPGLTLDSFCLLPAECLTEVWKGDTGADGGAESDAEDKEEEEEGQGEGPRHDAGELWKAERMKRTTEWPQLLTFSQATWQRMYIQ